EWSAY
ncbi:hypothetical protein D041_4890B, partial [Vibrio parahaemolyticus EKP-008]